MELTVSELAEAVAPIVSYPKLPTSEQVDLVIRRIRSWTVSGALRPNGDPHSGTGKHRRYGAESLPIAAVLNALAQNDQSIGTLLQVATFIRNLSGDDPLIAGAALINGRIALSSDQPVYMVTTKIGEEARWGMVTGENALDAHLSGFSGGIFVNITATLSRVKLV